MKRISLLLIVLISLTGVPPLQAEIVEDLYTVELPVADQTTSQRLALFNQAFREVITKVSGSVMAVESPGFKRPLNNSSRYVHQFRYVVRKDDNSDEFDSGQLMLSVVFNKDAIDNLLRENAIAIWGKERPSTLLLISYNVNKAASIVSSDTTPSVVEELDELSARKGLPVLFPLLDLEDRVRRRDVLIGEEEMVTFYKERIDGVTNLKELSKLLKKRGCDDFLRMHRENLIAHHPRESELSLYPPQIELGNRIFDCDYRFEPGRADDGLTVKVPAALAGGG